jgi:hypothetical protein
MYIFDTELWKDLKEVLSPDLQFKVNGGFAGLDFDYNTKRTVKSFKADRIFDLCGIKNVKQDNRFIAIVEYAGNVYNLKTQKIEFVTNDFLLILKKNIARSAWK